MSPELVLVDPELAVWARGRLGERRDSPVPSPAAPPLVTPRSAAREIGADGDRPAVATTPALPIWRRRRPFLAATMVLVVLAAAVLVVDSDAPGVRVLASGRPAPALEDEAASPTAPTGGAPPAAPRGGRDTSRPSAPGASARTKATAIAAPTRRFAWAPRPGASGYHVELFKGRELVFRATTSKPAIVIPRRWRLNGRIRTLEPGSYRWYVWPRVAGRRESLATVQAKLVVKTR